mgnify:CR=1 FL=1|jgi:hypothetical protein
MSKGKKTKHPPYRRQKYLCTAGEWRFCQKLEEAVGDRFTVMMQIRVGSLLIVPADDWDRWGRRVAQKSFDFALVARGSSYVAAVVELDDKTHLMPGRRKRDKFLDDACERADLPLIRFKTARRYDVDVIRNTIKDHLPAGATEVRPNDPPPTNASGKPLGWIWKRVQ